MYRVVKKNTPLLSGGFIEYKSVISVLLLKVAIIVLNHPTWSLHPIKEDPLQVFKSDLIENWM
jgi:hypothetical protein